jgi:hypothetical protein
MGLIHKTQLASELHHIKLIDFLRLKVDKALACLKDFFRSVMAQQ